MILAKVSDRAESITQFLTVLLVFILVLALTYLTTRFVGGYQKTRSITRNFEVIETYRIANGKYLQIVKVGQKYVVIGVGKDTVTNICELDPGDISTEPGDGRQSDLTFGSVLEKARRYIGKGSSNNEK